MTEVPGLVAYTTPDVGSTVATLLTLLLQVPPAGESVSADVLPVHIVVEPMMADGSGLTVNGVVM